MPTEEEGEEPKQVEQENDHDAEILRISAEESTTLPADGGFAKDNREMDMRLWLEKADAELRGVER
jgi:hypothetical protein